jgi:uncharacterized protein YukE
MVGDGTNVDPDELHSYAGKLRDRSGTVGEAADTTASIDLGFDTYGSFNQWFMGRARAEAGNITTTLRTLATNLNGDADTLDASARDFKNQDDATASHFKGMHP